MVFSWCCMTGRHESFSTGVPEMSCSIPDVEPLATAGGREAMTFWRLQALGQRCSSAAIDFTARRGRSSAASCSFLLPPALREEFFVLASTTIWQVFSSCAPDDRKQDHLQWFHPYLAPCANVYIRQANLSHIYSNKENCVGDKKLHTHHVPVISTNQCMQCFAFFSTACAWKM